MNSAQVVEAHIIFTNNSIHLGAYANYHFQSSFEVTPFFTVVSWSLFPNNRPFACWRHFTTTTTMLFVFPFIFKFGNPSQLYICNHKSPNLNKKANPLRILSSSHSCKMTLSFKWPIIIGSEKLLSFTFKIAVSIVLQIIS